MGSVPRSTTADHAVIAQGTSSSGPGQTQAADPRLCVPPLSLWGGALHDRPEKRARSVCRESITPVPGMPSGLVGVTNLRGTVIPLLDLRPMFDLNAEAALRYAVVVQQGNWQVGVLVDAVPEIRTIAKDQFLPVPAGTGEGEFPFVSTVVKLEDRLRGVLDTSVVLSHFEGTS